MKTKKKSKKPKMETSPPKGYGLLLGSDKLLEQEIEFIFEERDGTGNEYDFFLGKITRSPIVKSRTTGRYFILPWPDLLKLAIRAGLNKQTK
jgi:hypothetical protein